MTPDDRAALLSAVAAVCIESMCKDAQTAGVEVVVRYPGYTRNAVIRQTRHRPSICKRTKSGRPYAQIWRVVKWMDEDETKLQ